MSWDDVWDTVCPIAQSLSSVGDRWTLLIMRELSMGVRRFDDLQAQTGMSPHLLSTRLKRLEVDQVIARRIYSDRPARYEYFATEKGLELDPILAHLRAWGDKWGEAPGAPKGPASVIVNKTTGAPLDGSTAITSAFRFSDYDTTLSPEFTQEREAKRQAFLTGRRSKKSG